MTGGEITMSIGSEKDLMSLEKIGKIVSIAREEIIKAVKPRISTRELDKIGEKVFASYGARSAPIILTA
jgi:methionyl aminopeptidase